MKTDYWYLLGIVAIVLWLVYMAYRKRPLTIVQGTKYKQPIAM